ncbi:MAG TPA: carbohydrate ABC transporter permease [Paenibacillus sp.]|nr:carbohydrate ABC transporter permease [Paenibacillus sp.]
MYPRSVSSKLFDAFNAFQMIVISLLMIFPFYYILVYSVSEPELLGGGLILWPRGFSLEAYGIILSDAMVRKSILVSVMRTMIGPLLMIFVTAMAAYVLTRDEVPGVRFFRKFFVFTMYMGAGLIPMYLLIKELHMIGTFWVYVIPGAAAVFNMILIKTYIESVPRSLEEAALIDGANDFYLFWRIIFPLCSPVVAATVLFTAVGQWNDFIDTQIYNNMSPQWYTLQYALYQTLSSAESLAQAKSEADRVVLPQSLKMAVTMITVLPIAVVYPLLQKHFTKGLLIGSIKG